MNGRRTTFATSILVAVGSLLLSASTMADRLQVAVASNFRLAMGDLATRFESASGHELVLIAGSTGKQFAQIVNGAPFDAFFAADALRPQRLERAGRAIEGTRFTYAVGRIVLWSADERLIDDGAADLRRGAFRHLAIANPELAPYGAAARSVLQQLGLWEALQPKLVRGENIAQTFQFVASGNAELGFVARSQLQAPGSRFSGSGWTPPESLYPPIEQQAVLLRDSAAGRALMAFFRSEEAAAILRAHGYDLP